jgi:LuxR family maltose regulon positive regulatory protein
MTTSAYLDTQGVPLLRTKFHAPSPRPNLVPRPRLIQRLDEGLRRGHRLTLISAPAGFGKTTLIVEWLRQLEDSSPPERSVDEVPTDEGPVESKCAVAWLSLDDDDNNPTRFFTYLIAAIDRVQAGVGTDARALLQSPQPPPLKVVLTMLLNSLATMPADLVLVLDDYHVIEGGKVHGALAFLLDHLPSQAHLVIASRTDPPLPLARLRSRGQFTEIRAADLRFSPEEAATFLNHIMGLNLRTESITALEARTEGWIAGLQLAAVSMRGRGAEGISDFITAFSGSHRHVIDYLAEEVMAQQPNEIHDFLCQTAILNRLTAPLCDAVTEREDGHLILKKLDHENLFLVPLDDERRWYRYHHLFADFLRSHLNQDLPDQVPELHRRAARWCERNGLPAEAVDHALRAEDFERAARLIEHTAQALLMRGETTTLLRWFEALPDTLLHSRADLCISYAAALVVAGQLDAAHPLLDWAERTLELGSSDVGDQHPQAGLVGQLLALRAALTALQGDLDDFPHAAELARRASECLPKDDVFMNSVVTWLAGFTHYFDQDTAATSRLLAENIEVSQATGNVLLAALSIYMSGYLQVMQGHLHRARNVFMQGLQLAQVDSQPLDIGEQVPMPLGASLIYQGLGEIAREQNALDDAERYLRKSIELAEQWGNAEPLADSYVAMARTKQAQGDGQGANAVIRKARLMARENKVSPLTARLVEAYRARLLVAQGELEGTARWAASLADAHEASGDEGEDEEGQISLYVRGVEQNTLARLYIAQRKFEEATGLLEPLLTALTEAGWTGLTVEVLALQALARYSQDKTNEALAILGRALSLGQPEGYVRVFVDEGAPMAGLLRQAAVRGLAPGYANELLAAFESQAPGLRVAERDVVRADLQPQAHLIEPLTGRELEVLELIVAGLSNREIAERLYIAVSTVKTHINNVYGKLDVSSRTQAIARANELNLLG